MSDKQLLIIIHGMGKHTADSFKNEVVNGCNNALSRYESYKDIRFEDKVHIESISYDFIFEERRQEFAESGKDISEFISSNMSGSALPGFISELADIQQDLGEDEFVYTHVLDVLFYLSLVGEKVRLYVAEQIVNAIKKHPAGMRINILAHSLGTAVTHDTLHKLYSEGFTSSSGELLKTSQGDAIKLDPYTLPIDMLWTFANVSPIITSVSGLTSPLQSVVKPGGSGCVGSFLNIFHEFDPFTLKNINRFDPQKEDNWVDDSSYDFAYKRYKTQKVARLNTHSVGGYIDQKTTGGYLEDPLVCHDFLGSLFEFKPSQAERIDGDNAYTHVEGEALKIRDYVSQLDGSGSFSELKKLVTMLKSYKDFLGTMEF